MSNFHFTDLCWLSNNLQWLVYDFYWLANFFFRKWKTTICRNKSTWEKFTGDLSTKTPINNPMMKACLWFIKMRKTVMEESTLFVLAATDFSAPSSVSPSFFFSGLFSISAVLAVWFFAFALVFTFLVLKSIMDFSV